MTAIVEGQCNEKCGANMDYFPNARDSSMNSRPQILNRNIKSLMC